MFKLLQKLFNRRPKHHHISDIDLFFDEFDAHHDMSDSQIIEIEKHNKIFQQRDNHQIKKPKQPVTKPSDFLGDWDEPSGLP